MVLLYLFKVWKKSISNILINIGILKKNLILKLSIIVVIIFSNQIYYQILSILLLIIF